MSVCLYVSVDWLFVSGSVSDDCLFVCRSFVSRFGRAVPVVCSCCLYSLCVVVRVCGARLFVCSLVCLCMCVFVCLCVC